MESLSGLSPASWSPSKPSLPLGCSHSPARAEFHTGNFTLVTDGGDLDLLGEIAGVGGYAEVSAVSMPVSLFGENCAVLSLRALIAARRASGRPKDLQLLPELEALQGAIGED